jgi:SAM-dependent methyltransferase
MAERPEPLVRELERRPGQQDPRWIHLLGPVPEQAADAPVDEATAAGATADRVPVDRDAVIAGGADQRDERVRSSYDAIATDYSANLVNELRGLDFETWLLDRVLAHAGERPVVEVGSGPGHITAYLADGGADAVGIDLSPAMVAEARRRFPDGSYEVGDLRRLGPPAGGSGWAAVLAWYSLIHLAASEMPDAIAALLRPLAPGGWLVLALHAGTEVRHFDEWFDHEISLDFVLHEQADVVGMLEAAGLVDIEWYLRGPLSSRAETTERLYVVGRTPA